MIVKNILAAKQGDVVTIETPGGGGWASPSSGL